MWRLFGGQDLVMPSKVTTLDRVYAPHSLTLYCEVDKYVLDFLFTDPESEVSEPDGCFRVTVHEDISNCFSTSSEMLTEHLMSYIDSGAQLFAAEMFPSRYLLYEV